MPLVVIEALRVIGDDHKAAMFARPSHATRIADRERVCQLVVVDDHPGLKVGNIQLVETGRSLLQNLEPEIT